MHDYIEKLIQRGEMLVVDKQVDPKFELAAVTAQSQRESEAPIMFRNVKGSNLPVVSNIYGSYARMCELIGVEKGGSFCKRWVELTDAGGARTEGYNRTVAAPADLVEGKLSDLPQIQYFERDAGAYITAGVFLAKEPDSGIPNLSFCRTMMVSDEELRVRLAPPHDITQYQKMAESRDEPLEVAILIGPPPEVFLASCASVPYEANEVAIAAQIRGEELEMRPCKTIDLNVPLDTEVVIEGRILPNIRRPEGPFGEFMGYYVEETDNHVFEITNVSWRRDAAFHGLVCGSPEDLRALELSFATRTYRALAAELPGIIDVTCNPAPQHTIVQIDKQYEGHAQHVMLKAFGSNVKYNKICIVVDDDVDISNFNDVWWAVVSRCRVDRKVMTVPEAPGFYRDEPRVHWGRLGIDATRPWGHEKQFERKRIPGGDNIDLRDYLTNR